MAHLCACKWGQLSLLQESWQQLCLSWQSFCEVWKPWCERWVGGNSRESIEFPQGKRVVRSRTLYIVLWFMTACWRGNLSSNRIQKKKKKQKTTGFWLGNCAYNREWVLQHVILVVCLGSLQGVSGNEVSAWMRAGGSGRGEGTVNKNSEWEERMGFIDGPDTRSTTGE